MNGDERRRLRLAVDREVRVLYPWVPDNELVGPSPTPELNAGAVERGQRGGRGGDGLPAPLSSPAAGVPRPRSSPSVLELALELAGRERRAARL